MKKIDILNILFFLGIALFFLNFASGPAAMGSGDYTGASGSFTCGGCHGGGPYGSTTVSFALKDMGTGTSVTQYNPGQTYDLTVTVNAGNGSPGGYGFQMVALTSSNQNGGTLKNGGPNMQLPFFNSRIYAEHDGVSASNTFNMEWTAPLATSGSITFYYAGNSVNGTGNPAGDNGSAGFTTIIAEAILPVELSAFSLTLKERNVFLQWQTVSEINSDYFEIQRNISSKNDRFETIGKVQSAGNSNTTINYEFLDESPIANQDLYYRLKQVDLDGTINYSAIESLRIGEENTISIFPNPIQLGQDIVVEYVNNTPDNQRIVITNLAGQIVFEKIYADDFNDNQLAISSNELLDGIYFISIFQNDRWVQSEKLVVNN